MTLLQDTNGNTSSKRLMGIIGASISIACIVYGVITSTIWGHDIGSNTTILVSTMFISSCGLLGVTVFEKKQTQVETQFKDEAL